MPILSISKVTTWILSVAALLGALVILVTRGKQLLDLLPGRRHVAKIEVSIVPPNAPPEATVGSALQLKATLKDSRGNEVERSVTWTADPSDITTVLSNCIVTGRAKGHATVTATSERISQPILLHVGHVPVHSIEIFPPKKNMPVGDTLRFEATPKDAQGNSLDNTGPAEWTSNTDGIAKVLSNDGLVKGISPGNATIFAQIDGQQGSASVAVQGPPPSPPSQLAAKRPPAATPQPAPGTPPHKNVIFAPKIPLAAIVQPPVAAQPVLAPAGPTIVLVNGPEMAQCTRQLRFYFDDTLGDILVEQKLNSVPVVFAAAGKKNYTVGGTVSCSASAPIHASGTGAINVTKAHTFVVHLQHQTPTDVLVKLQ